MSEQKTVLLADDVELFLELEKTFFRRGDIRLLVARNGEEALEIIGAERPDLVFMDLYMPLMSGDQCCRKVKADPQLSSVPIVMVTHGGKHEELVRCKDAGCDDIVLKPINRHSFLQTARKYLQVTDRIAPRVPARLQVGYGVEQPQTLRDYTINVSTGGLFLETEELLEVDTALSLQFEIKDLEAPIRCQGRVAWLNKQQKPIKPNLPAGMGIQFVDLSLEDLAAIREYVKEQCLLPSW